MIKVTDRGYWLDTFLKQQLDTVHYNMDCDWDFVWVVTGNGETRTGKTVMAQQLGYYISHKRDISFTAYNMCFSGQELREKAHKSPPGSVFVYDESRAELDTKNSLTRITKNLLDFFSECGKYNHFILLVMPDFFELNQGIAITRSSALINCYKKGKEAKDSEGNRVTKFIRGYFSFYGRKQKKQLYLLGKKKSNYQAYRQVFGGEFRNHWVVDFDKYDKKKNKFLTRGQEDTQKSKYEQRIELMEKRTAHMLAMLRDYLSHCKLEKELKQREVPISRAWANKLIEKYCPSPDTRNKGLGAESY